MGDLTYETRSFWGSKTLRLIGVYVVLPRSASLFSADFRQRQYPRVVVVVVVENANYVYYGLLTTLKTITQPHVRHSKHVWRFRPAIPSDADGNRRSVARSKWQQNDGDVLRRSIRILRHHWHSGWSFFLEPRHDSHWCCWTADNPLRLREVVFMGFGLLLVVVGYQKHEIYKCNGMDR